MPRTFHVRDSARRERRVFLATPSYAGVSSPYLYSLLHSIEHLRSNGWSVDWCHLEGNCHVDDARNFLVRAFLESDCTDLVFLDSDVGWQANDLLNLLSHDRNVVAGVYPRKRDGADYPAVLPDGEIWADASGLIEAARVPTGFLRLRRNVLQALYDKEPRKYHGGRDGKERLPQAIIFERTYADGHRISGDYSCSDKIRALGFKINIAPEIPFTHEGQHEWSGCYGDYLRAQAGITDHRLKTAVAAMRAGTADLAHFVGMAGEYGNTNYSATPELLYSLYLTAREVTGPILETGTGLSSVVLAVVSETTGNPVISLEHDKGWLQESKKLLSGLGLTHRPTFAPLADGWYGFDDVPDLALALCDGPQRQHGRAGLFKKHLPRLKSAIVVLDDYETEADLVSEYLPGRPVTVLGERRKFAVVGRA